MTVTAPELFSRRLRAATAVQHEAAEESGFMSALTSGALSRDAYAALAGQLWFVYSALEESAAQLRQDPVAGPFVLDELNRIPQLEADLATLLGPEWRAELKPTGAAEAYAARIRGVAAEWAPAFVAHHYTRYLGDLSGGQILRRVLVRHYEGLEGALSFFDFEDIPRPKPFKDDYRARLDAVALDEAGQDRVIEEARLAFDLNTALFAALGDRFLPSSTS